MRTSFEPQRLADQRGHDRPEELALGIRELRSQRASTAEIAALAARLDLQLTTASTGVRSRGSSVSIASVARWLVTVLVVTGVATYATVKLGGAGERSKVAQPAGSTARLNAEPGANVVVPQAATPAQEDASAMRPSASAPSLAATRMRRAVVARAARAARPGNVPPLTAAARKPEEELALLGRAHDALAVNPSEALALAEQHRSEYAAGLFAQEREVIAIEALLALSRKPAAIARAQAFLDRYPTSPHARRVKPLLERAQSTTTSAVTDHP